MARQDRKYSQRTPDRDVLTTGQVADVLGVAPRTVSQWIDRGILPGFRLPSGVDNGHKAYQRRVRREDVIRFARENGIPCLLEVGARVVLVGVPETAAPAWSVRVPSLFDLAINLDREAVSHVIVINAAIGRSETMAAVQLLRKTLRRVFLIVVLTEDDTDRKPWSEAGFDEVVLWPAAAETMARVIEEAIRVIR